MEEKLWQTQTACEKVETVLTKMRLVKAMVFLVVMYGYENWTVKKVKHWRINAIELWYWRRLLRVPWTARRSNQYIIKEINPKYLLEGLMLKLKLQYFGHLMWRTDTRKDPDAGKYWRQKEKGTTEDEMVGWHHWLYGTEGAGSKRWWRTGKLGVLQSMGSERVGHDCMTAQQLIKQSLEGMDLNIIKNISLKRKEYSQSHSMKPLSPCYQN